MRSGARPEAERTSRTYDGPTPKCQSVAVSVALMFSSAYALDKMRDLTPRLASEASQRKLRGRYEGK